MARMIRTRTVSRCCSPARRKRPGSRPRGRLAAGGRRPVGPAESPGGPSVFHHYPPLIKGRNLSVCWTRGTLGRRETGRSARRAGPAAGMEARYMIDLVLSWRAAAVTAACLAGASAAARRTARRRRPAGEARRLAPAGPGPRRLPLAAGIAQEAAVLLGLFALWQLAGSYACWARAARWPGRDGSGTPNALFTCPARPRCSERSSAIHWSSRRSTSTTPRCTSWSLISCLVWVYIWHRRQYPQVRTTLVLFTAGALLIQFLPVAPPRMLPGTAWWTPPCGTGSRSTARWRASTPTSSRQCPRCTWAGRCWSRWW